MAKEDVQAFNKGFAALTKQMKENRIIEQEAAKQAHTIELAQMEAAVVNAKHDRKVLEDELKELNSGSKKDQESMDKMLAKQDEVIDASKKEADAFKGELEVAKETRNTMLEMRNLTEEQVQTEKEQIAEIEDMKNAQKAYKESYEKTEGAKATDSKIFNKTNLDIAQKELNMRKASAKRDGISKSGQEEIDKEQKRINSDRGTVFGKMANGIMSMKENIGKILGTAGKGLLGGAIFLAIGAFLQSEYFQKIVNFIFDTLIPKLKEFYDAFFGPEGGIIKGFKTLFGDDSGIGSIVLGIGAVLLLFVGFKIAGLILAVTSMFGAFKSLGSKLFGGKGALVGKDGLKGSKGIFSKLGSSLKGFMSGIAGFASKGLDMVKNAGSKLINSAKNMAKGALDLAKKGITSLKTGGKNLVDTGSKLAKGGGDLVKKSGGVVKQTIKGTASKTAASAAKVFKMFPRLGLAAKLVPGLGTILAAGQGISILMDDKMSKNDKIKEFGGLLGGTLGSVGFGALGAALGTGIFPGIGTVAGGIIGGALGYFGGDWAGRKAANFLLGEEVDEQKVAEELKSAGAMPGGPPGSVGSTKSLQTKPIQTAKFETVKSKSTSSIMAKGPPASGGSTESDMDVIKTVPVNDNKDTAPIIVNAPQNNNAVTNSNTSTTNSGFVEPDPMFRRNSQYAI